MADSNAYPFNVIEQAKQRYPILQRYNDQFVYKYTPKGAGSHLETWPPGEAGTPDSPRPAEFPSDKYGVEIYDPQIDPDMIAGDIISHGIRNLDPNMRLLYDQFERSVLGRPEQRQRLYTDYQWERLNNPQGVNNGTRNITEWAKTSRIPDYFRGYMFRQLDPRRWGEWYTPEQMTLFRQMEQYIHANPIQQPSGNNDPGAVDQRPQPTIPTRQYR